MGKRRVLLAGVAVVVGATGVGGMAVANGGRERLRAELKGANEVPPADPDGRGRGTMTFEVRGDELCFSVRFDDIGAPNRGHIHTGVAGSNGGIAVTLFELADPITTQFDGRHDELEKGRLSRCVPADPAVLAAIAQNPAAYYVNLHNSRFPGGAVRGQLHD